MEYKIGITSYDNDHELWETHIGFGEELLFSVWGPREVDSKARAHELWAYFTQNLQKRKESERTDNELFWLGE